MDSWSNVTNALRWLGLKWLKITSTLQTNVIYDRISAAADAYTVNSNVPPLTSDRFSILKGTGLYGELHNAGINVKPVGEPAAWFSSLWTLQECVLCLDLQLYTKDCQRLEDGWSNAIPLRALMVFIRETWNYCWLDERLDTPLYHPAAYDSAVMRHPSRRTRRSRWDWQLPPSIDQLLNFCAMTRLDNVLTSGLSTTVFINANTRQATSSRVPAIMSAVGVTNWYNHCLMNKSKTKNLVFEKHPLDFLREAVQKLGAIFNESSSSRSIPRIGFRDSLFQKRRTCSMLPFTRDSGWFCGITGSAEHVYIERKDHPTVRTWKICHDGTVNLPKVGMTSRLIRPRRLRDSSISSSQRRIRLDAKDGL